MIEKRSTELHWICRINKCQFTEALISILLVAAGRYVFIYIISALELAISRLSGLLIQIGSTLIVNNRNYMSTKILNYAVKPNVETSKCANPQISSSNHISPTDTCHFIFIACPFYPIFCYLSFSVHVSCAFTWYRATTQVSTPSRASVRTCFVTQVKGVLFDWSIHIIQRLFLSLYACYSNIYYYLLLRGCLIERLFASFLSFDCITILWSFDPVSRDSTLDSSSCSLQISLPIENSYYF